MQKVEALRRAGGRSYVPVELHRRAHRSGDDWIIVGVARDIRARIEAEHALPEHSKRQSLIARFGQRALAATALAPLLAKAAAVVAEGLDCDFTCILRIGADTALLAPVAGTGWGAVADADGAAADGALARMPIHASVLAGESSFVDDFQADSRFTNRRLFQNRLGQLQRAAGVATALRRRSVPAGPRPG